MRVHWAESGPVVHDMAPPRFWGNSADLDPTVVHTSEHTPGCPAVNGTKGLLINSSANFDTLKDAVACEGVPLSARVQLWLWQSSVSRPFQEARCTSNDSCSAATETGAFPALRDSPRSGCIEPKVMGFRREG